jgi:hypothetical protein
MGILRRESIPSDKGVGMKVASFSIFLLNNIIICPWIQRLGARGVNLFSTFYPSVVIVILRGLLGRCITQSTGNNPLITHGKGQPTAQPTHTHTTYFLSPCSLSSPTNQPPIIPHHHHQPPLSYPLHSVLPYLLPVIPSIESSERRVHPHQPTSQQSPPRSSPFSVGSPSF